jgi:hypothetical protein
MMPGTPITYTNRRGQKYYLHVGRTKTGKDKFFFSKKAGGELCTVAPEGFEVYENPDGLVVLRRELKTFLDESELSFIRRSMRTMTSLEDYQYTIDHDKDTITIFVLDDDPVKRLAELNPLWLERKNADRDYALRFGHYAAMVRFRLVEKEKRLFRADRFCFRGSVDDWIEISGPETLDTLAKRFLKHLGQESFYDLLPY